jgi:hypothetical protein
MLGKKALDLVAQIDKSLEKINEVLHRSQPPYPGKLRIIFIDEGGLDRMPSFAVLKTNRHKQHYLVKLPRKNIVQKVRCKGTFSINTHQTKALVREASRLMDVRTNIKRMVRMFGLWEGNLLKNHRHSIAESFSLAEEYQAEVESNLMNKLTKEERLELLANERDAIEQECILREAQDRG